jgi:hypothetical protein
LESKDTIFVDPNADNYYLDTLRSKASGFAAPLQNILKDLENRDRDPVFPDLGCFELKI